MDLQSQFFRFKIIKDYLILRNAFQNQCKSHLVC